MNTNFNAPLPEKGTMPTQNAANIMANKRLLVILVIISLATEAVSLAIAIIGGFGRLFIPPMGILILLALISLFFVQRNIFLPAQILLPGSLYAVVTYIIIAPPGTGIHDFNLLAYALVIVLASLTLGETAVFIFAALIILAVFGIAFAEMNGILVSETSALTIPIFPFIISTVTLGITFTQRTLIKLLNESIQRAQASEREVAERNVELEKFSVGLEKLVQERTTELNTARLLNERRARQFEAVAQVARSISSTQNFDILLPQITKLISREFGFYHVGVFLLDSQKEYAILSAANSEGGQRMLARSHRLKVGETGLVGYVTSTGKARVALDTEKDTVFFDNPDLPATRSEIALPLRIGSEIIGALDVQSTESNAFLAEDINVLGTLADQVSIALQNTRQYEATRKALTESEALARQFIQTGWQQFSKGQNLVGVRHTGVRSTLLYEKDTKGQDGESGTLNRDQPRTKARGVSLSLPVKLHGEVIGTVNVRSPLNRQFDQDELDIVTAIIERAAIAMENARLLSESQKRAAKERTIGEISAKISAQSDIDELLKIAARELNRTLPGTEIAIQLNQDQEAGNA